MTYYVFDASALVKAYLPENGTARVLVLLAAAADGQAGAVVSALAYPETMSALMRRQRSNRLSAEEAAARARRVAADFAGPRPMYDVAEVTPLLAHRAADLVRNHALSGADAIHLATAVALRAGLAAGAAVELVTADARLVLAARAESLPVEDLTHHEPGSEP